MPFRLPILQSVALPALAHFFDGVTFGVHGLVFFCPPPLPKIKWFGATDFLFFNGRIGEISNPATMSNNEQLGCLGFAGSRPGSCHTWP